MPKNHAESRWSASQMEPNVASYGPKPCLGGNPVSGGVKVGVWGSRLAPSGVPKSSTIHARRHPRRGLRKSGAKVRRGPQLLTPLTLPNWLRGVQNQGFQGFGNLSDLGSKLAPFWEPWGGKWCQFGGSGAMSKAELFPGASKGHPDTRS